MKKNKLSIILFSLFLVLLSLTIYTSFSTNIEVEEIKVKSMTPVYDEDSGVVFENEKITFNDKNQVVKYNVVLENNNSYDVSITDIKLSTLTEEFLSYEVEDLKDKVVKSNSTKEITISFETTGIEGWGRNFDDELLANISFEKLSKEEESDKEEIPKEDTPTLDDPIKAPVKDTEELKSKTEKIEIIKVTEDTIEFKETEKLQTGDKIAIWIYSEPKFLGYFDVIVEDGIKKIKGLEEALTKLNIEPGDHTLAIVTEEETIGYINVYLDEEEGLLAEKEKTNNNPTTPNKPNKEDNSTKEENKVDNPYTSDKRLVGILGIATCATGILVLVVSKNKFTKYSVLIIMLSSTLSLVNAEDIIELPIKFNVAFKSQNVMKKSGCKYDSTDKVLKGCTDYWEYRSQIKEFYIQNKIIEIKDYTYKFDVTEEQNGRVKAYLVKNKEDSNYYNLYLQADGIIYPSEDASYYFGEMENLDILDNLTGFDTSNVVNMSGMFFKTGYNSTIFTMDVSNFVTSNVTDMNRMFDRTGYSSTKVKIDVSNFDTSKVTNMRTMFQAAAYNNKEFVLDVSNFDTSNVTDMAYMFRECGNSSENISLNLSNFDTSKVTNMSNMFSHIGISNKNFVLDVSNFDTSKVTNMSAMFQLTGANTDDFKLELSNFDTSNVTNMSYMFYQTGYNSKEFELDVSNFDTSKVTDMSYMFNQTGYNSTKLNISILVSNNNVTSYDYMFIGAATKEGSQITVNYTSKTSDLVDKMIATKSDGANVVKGKLVEMIIDDIDIGDELAIGTEHFNVISQTDDTVTMLAKWGLDTNYKQSSINNYVTFSDTNGWEYTPGPKEIDIQLYDGNAKTYVNEYVDYLRKITGDENITGDLITLKELGSLGCTVPSDYAWNPGGWNCLSSSYGWIANGQYWWTKSANPAASDVVWVVSIGGKVYDSISSSDFSIRPTITISKETLKGLNS